MAAVRAAGVKAIDLSADFRIHDAATYERWYSTAHTQTTLLADAVYGLPELHRAEIADASLVANPGCYPTSVILGLWPLAEAGKPMTSVANRTSRKPASGGSGDDNC